MLRELDVLPGDEVQVRMYLYQLSDKGHYTIGHTYSNGETVLFDGNKNGRIVPPQLYVRKYEGK